MIAGVVPAGRVHAMYLFEVGDAIDVRSIPTFVPTTTAAPLTMRPAAPPYLQYVASLFAMTAARIGLNSGGKVREKLKTLDVIYRFAVEHAAMTRGELLELIVVILILLELVLLVVTGLH